MGFLITYICVLTLTLYPKSICYIFRIIHTEYGSSNTAREMEFKHVKELFGPYENALFWSSTRGGFIKEEKQRGRSLNKVTFYFRRLSLGGPF